MALLTGVICVEERRKARVRERSSRDALVGSPSMATECNQVALKPPRPCPHLHEELIASDGAARARDVACHDREARGAAERDGTLGAKARAEGVAAAGGRGGGDDVQRAGRSLDVQAVERHVQREVANGLAEEENLIGAVQSRPLSHLQSRTGRGDQGPRAI